MKLCSQGRHSRFDVSSSGRVRKVSLHSRRAGIWTLLSSSDRKDNRDGESLQERVSRVPQAIGVDDLTIDSISFASSFIS